MVAEYLSNEVTKIPIRILSPNQECEPPTSNESRQVCDEYRQNGVSNDRSYSSTATCTTNLSFIDHRRTGFILIALHLSEELRLRQWQRRGAGKVEASTQAKLDELTIRLTGKGTIGTGLWVHIFSHGLHIHGVVLTRKDWF